MSSWDGTGVFRCVSPSLETNGFRKVQGIAVNPTTGRVFISSEGFNAGNAIMDGSNCGLLLNDIPRCNNYSRQIVYNPMDERFYATGWGAGNVGVYDGSNGATLNCIPTGAVDGWGTTINIPQQRVYASFSNPKAIYSIDIASATSTDSIVLGANLSQIAYDPVTCRVFAPEYDLNQILIASDLDGGKCDVDQDGFDNPTPVSHQGPANTNPTFDNCPFVANPSQTNNDGNFIDNSPPYSPSIDDRTRAYSDGLGDACDSDDDNDGLSDDSEMNGPCVSTLFPTDPLKLDTDGDRVTDGAECALGSDPASAASKPPPHAPANPPSPDTDGDGLTDAFEATIGTNPAVKDTDGDGLQDGWEYKGYGSNPLVVDTDGDVVTDGCEVASLNGDTVVNSGDQGLLAAEMLRAVPQASKLANFDMNKDGAINSGDQGFQDNKAIPGKCP